MKLEISQQILDEFSNIKYHENSSCESLVVLCGQTDRHDEANSHFSQFCEHTWRGYWEESNCRDKWI